MSTCVLCGVDVCAVASICVTPNLCVAGLCDVNVFGLNLCDVSLRAV